ncbi:hypothetical protein EXIGLDRAFT_725850 [Exidia glandulosa HHB12029]|uniref:Zn(2)-C6 fungal-type domain-containing protein n=1 Tax=Exidia glandulosa HHB12029 TaxID=1314781 RepID=A0A165MG43_EXIGL|nr:hypothetical protein EXIGLDRAFT_725850 [Exidia glandulosa HHB12029]
MSTTDSGLCTPVYIPPVAANELHKGDEPKRRRGPVSCAECRRLKLKCDRKVPCSSCCKRGCAAICPNGTLTAGPGNRFVLADTEHLHEKIQAMGKRINELEDALAALQAQLSTDPHPLLAPELLHLKALPPTQNVDEAVNQSYIPVCDALGTLTLGDRAQFFGNNAHADYLLEATTHESPAAASSLPLDLLLLADAFPMTSVQELKDDVYRRLADWLPPPSEAWMLIDTYYMNAAWMFNPIPKDEFVETIAKRVYPTPHDRASLADVTPHDAAVICMVFAEASITAADRAPCNVEALNYYQLARVALGVDSVIDHPTLQAVRAVHMMTTFLHMVDHPNGATACYMLLGLAAQVCQSLGLHRKDTQWGIPEEECQKRRHVFWEVLSFDMWTSLAFGRPPSFSYSQVDAIVADDTERFVGQDGTLQASYRLWNHTFSRECLLKVMDQAFGVTPPAYGTVLRLDRLVREHPISESLRLVNVGHVEAGHSTALILQRNTVFALSQKLLLYLHRSFFAKALMEHPQDPLKSKYAQSVLASFRSAYYITASARALYAAIPLSLRFWHFWSQCFSASVILGSIVIRSPGSGLAPAAWIELDRVYTLFERVAPESRRVARMMPKMRRLREKAHESYTAFTAASDSVPQRQCKPEEEMELLFMWGWTRLINTRSAPADAEAAGTNTDTDTELGAGIDPFASFVPPESWNPIPLDSAPTHEQMQQWAEPFDIFSLVNSTGAPQFDQSFAMGGADAPLPLPQAPLSMLGSSVPLAPGAKYPYAPLSTPSPESAAATLEGTLDTTWQRFMDGIGLSFDEVQGSDGSS